MEYQPTPRSITGTSGDSIQDDGKGTYVTDDDVDARRIWYVVGGFVIVFAVLAHLSFLVIIGLLLVAIGAIPELWYRFCLEGVVVRESVSSARAVMGDELKFTLAIENRKPLPLPWLELEADIPDALPVSGMDLPQSYRQTRLALRQTMSLWLYQRLTRRYTLRATRRGAFEIGPISLRSGDPFGLLARQQRRELRVGVIVYPLVVPITRLGLPARHPFGERTARQRVLEDPMRAAGIRPYMQGDEPRRIHWKATARTGTLQSKVYEPATRHTLVLFTDVRTMSNRAFGYDDALFELALCASGSLVAWAQQQGYAVGIYANGTLAQRSDPVPAAPARTGQATTRVTSGVTALRLRVPPSTNVAQLPRVLELLARLYPYMGVPMEQVIAAETPDLPLGATVLYVGAAAAISDATVATLERLRARGHNVVLMLTGGDDDVGVATGTLPVHRLGGREVWHALESEALAGTGQRGFVLG